MSQRLTLTTTSLLNTTISNETDAIYYDIQTPEWEPHLTTVRRLKPRMTNAYEPTGTIWNQADRPVAVSMHGGPVLGEDQWIKKVNSSASGESAWQFEDGMGNTLAWSVVGDTLELRIPDEDAETKRTLATFHQHKRYFIIGMISGHAYLEIDNSIISSVDPIVVSLLIVERKRRAGIL